MAQLPRQTKRRGNLVGSALVAGFLLFATISGGVVAAGLLPQCGPMADGSVRESTAYVPFQARRSAPIELPIKSSGASSALLPSSASELAQSIDDRTASWVVVVDTGAVYRYYFDKELPDALTRSEFFAQDGVEFDIDPIVAEQPFYQYLIGQFPDRAVAVEVGGFDGAITWADPEANGVRTHNVYWSDGKSNFALVANRSAEEAVTLARTIACR